MQDKHITGPWRRTSDHQSWRATHEGFGNSCYQAIQDERTGKVVALVVAHAGHDEPEPDTRAIANMVEATPQLAVALRRLLREYIFTRTMDGTTAEDCETMECVSAARAALAKATGSTP